MLKSPMTVIASMLIFSFFACNNLSEQVENKLNSLQNKTDSLDALINQEIEKVTNLDSLINTEHQKVRKLDSVIQKTGERIDSFTGNKAKQIERLVR
jgi:peptidoglycan hydrolase CwlO-like protein